MNTIKRFKARIDIQHILMIILVFMLSFSIVIPITTIPIYAEGTSDFAGTGGGSQQASSGSGHPYYARTGWLVYICRESTGTLLSNVVYVNSTNSINTRGLQLNTDYLLSRVGGQGPSGPHPMIVASGGCPWGTPWTDSGKTRYKEVENYFIDGTSLSEKAKQNLLIFGFPSNIVEQIVTDDDVCLILENCAYYRLNGQYYLASSYGFGKLYSEQPNICNDTNGAKERFYGLGSVQQCEHFDEDHGNLPSKVNANSSAWTAISAADAANQSMGWGLSYINKGQRKRFSANGTGVLRESQITRGLPMGGSADNNTKCTGNREHNKKVVNTKMFEGGSVGAQQMETTSVKFECGGHWHYYTTGCGQKHYDANGNEVSCPGNDAVTSDSIGTCGGGPDFLSGKKVFWFRMNAPTIVNETKKCVLTDVYSNVKWETPWNGGGAKYEEAPETTELESLKKFDTKLIMCRAMDGVTIAKWKQLPGVDVGWLQNKINCNYGNQGGSRTLSNTDSIGGNCFNDGCSQYNFTLKWNYSATYRKYGYTVDAGPCGHGVTYTAETKSSKAEFKGSVVPWFESAQQHTVTIETYKGELMQGGQETPKNGIPDVSIDSKRIRYVNDKKCLYDGANYLSDTITVFPKGNINFYPYIQMSYTKTPGNLSPEQNVYVLGEYKREVQANDCAEIEYKQSMESNMTLSSTQWSTHQAVLANNKWKSWKDVVLPGGATFNVDIDSSNYTTVHLRTFQVILEGDGLDQVKATAGDVGENFTEKGCIGNHYSFVSSVVRAFENTNMQQWWSPKTVTSEHNSGWDSSSIKYQDTLWNNKNNSEAMKVGNESSGDDNVRLHGGDNNNKFTSQDTKYYLSVDTNGGHSELASEGDLDVGIISTSGTEKISNDDLTIDANNNIAAVRNSKIWKNTTVTKYTFYTIPTSQGLYVKKNGTLVTVQSEIDKIIDKVDARTSLPTNMLNALEQGTGHDEESGWGEGWYNEAMDGITVMECDTKIKVGYLLPKERSAVLDTLLTPKNTGGKTLAKLDNNGNVQSDGLFAKAYYSQISTKDHTEIYKNDSDVTPSASEWKDRNDEDRYLTRFSEFTQTLPREKFTKMGVFHGQPVYMYNLENLYYTKKFIIPNVTVQDLY